MATNVHFTQGTTNEQTLYEDLVIESLKIYGQDVYYIPREIVNRDRILQDDTVSRFDNAYRIEMYIENTDGFDGEGDLFTKFGVEIRDAATFIVARRRWQNSVARFENDPVTRPFYRPREGDLIYLTLSKSMFEITRVETERPFYQLKDLPVFQLRCELFDYNDEDLDTGVEEIDLIETIHAYQTKLFIPTSAESRATATASISGGELSGLTLTDGGNFYRSKPTVTVSDPPTGATVSISLLSSGAGYTPSTGVSTSGGSGTGLTVDTVGSGGVVGVTINARGTGYEVGDSVTIDGGAGGFLARVRIDSATSSSFGTATVTANFSTVTNKVTTFSITDNGAGYSTAPTITIADPNIRFDVGEDIHQGAMRGEVVRHDDSAGILYIAHSGSTSGEYSEWVTTSPIVGQTNNVSITPTSIGEDLQDGAMNDDFNVIGDGFVDFSESNPFGDPQ